jgi:DNA-binding XRE family transcriptional regulator
VLPAISTPAVSTISRTTRLSQLRIERGLSREKLAARAGLSARTIFNLERCIGQPQAITVAALARALGCSAEDIFATNEQRQDGHPGVAKTADAGGGHGSS